MNLRSTCLLFVLGLGSLSVAHAEPAHDDARPLQDAARDANSCAQVSPVARYEAYAYTHVVELKNTCMRPVTCEVWTDVDPQPRYTLSAKPGETSSVLVRRGSPARTFKAEKSCKY